MNGLNRGVVGTGIGWALGVTLMSGCIAGHEADDDAGGDGASLAGSPAAARMAAPALSKRCGPSPRPGHGHGGIPPGSGEEVLLMEEWNSFDPALWTGDGDEWVARGLFTAREGAASTAADWRPDGGIAIDGGRTVLFSNELTTDPDAPADLRGRAAQFFVSRDSDDSFRNYLIVDARYFPREGRVTIETYGLTGDADFDRVFDLPWSRAAEGRLRIDIAVSAEQFEVSLDGRSVDRIAMAPMSAPGVYLLETGVQRTAEGALGLIDRTSITLKSPATGGHGGGYVRCKHRNASMAEKREHMRRARERIAHCARPSHALKASARAFR